MGVRCVKIRVWHLAYGYDSICERNRSDARFCGVSRAACGGICELFAGSGPSRLVGGM